MPNLNLFSILKQYCKEKKIYKKEFKCLVKLEIAFTTKFNTKAQTNNKKKKKMKSQGVFLSPLENF